MKEKEPLKISKTMYEMERRMANKNLWAIRFFILYLIVGLFVVSIFFIYNNKMFAGIITIGVIIWLSILYFNNKYLRKFFGGK